MDKLRKNILVIKLRHIGDVVIVTPLFEALRSNNPNSLIVALVNKGTESVLVHNPNIDKILTVESFKNPIFNFLKQIALMRSIRKLRFDLVLELTKNDRGALFSYISGAEKRIAFRSRKPKRFDRHLLFTHLVAPNENPNLHVVDAHWEMIRYLGYLHQKRHPSLYWTYEEEAICGAILNTKGISLHDKFVVMHPIMKAKYKAWRADSYSAICEYLYNNWSIQTILVGGKEEKEVAFIGEIVKVANCPCIHLGGQLSLRQLIALIAHAFLFIGIDSGPMHIAAALNTPLVAIFGPSSKERWGPYGQNHTVIQKQWECVPCRKQGCNGQGISRCLEELTIDEVITVLESKIKDIIGQSSTLPTY